MSKSKPFKPCAKCGSHKTPRHDELIIERFGYGEFPEEIGYLRLCCVSCGASTEGVNSPMAYAAVKSLWNRGKVSCQN